MTRATPRQKRVTRTDEAMELWDTPDHGEKAAERLLTELRDSPVHAMIDRRTVRWQVLRVRHASGGSATRATPARRGR
jgi:hypothetical protein